MSTYCTQSDGIAIVKLTKNGNSFEVRCSNPPITITCKNNSYPDCTKVKVTVVYKDDLGQTITNYYDHFAPILGLRIENNKQWLSIMSKGGGSTCATLQWRVIGDAVGTSHYYVNAAITAIDPITTNPTPNSKGIKIVDALGNTVFDDNTIDCSWNVVCGNECADGEMKCSSNQYPGYCCISCSEVSGKIETLINLAKSKQ